MDSLQPCVFLLMVLVVKAEEEPFLGQRGVIFELSDLEDGDFVQEPILQKPLTFPPSYFSEPDEDQLRQKEVLPDISLFQREVLQPGPPMFGPRSMGPPQIQFPLARPKPNNVQAICRNSNQRPRYLLETLPQSGFSYLTRQAKAVNQLESWFTGCCSHGTENEEQLLCCAEQAWKKSLSAFCEEEFAIKTNHYYCCKEKGSAKWGCFEKAAPNQFYQPSSQGSWADIPSVPGDFQFDPDMCQKSRSQIAPRAVRGRVSGVLNIYFPPGRPNSANVGSICTNRKQRRQFLASCLPRKGYHLLANEVKAINDLEKAFNQCCKQKKGKQACAEKKWKMMVDAFCMNEKEFDCCDKDGRKEQYDCFAAAAPNPDYVLNNASMSVIQARPTLDMFCDMYSAYHRTAKKMDFELEMFAGKLSKQCCHPMEEKNPACLHTKLDDIVEEACEDQLMRPMVCCKENPKDRSKCVTKRILRKLSDDLNYNSRKKCPVLF